MRPPLDLQPTPSGEVRTTDPTTGAQKGSKLARFGLIPAAVLWELAEHFGKGCRKYADRNWERGYDWELSFSALNRHLWAWWNGEEFDNHRPDCPPDCTEHLGSHHLVAVIWHAFVLRTFTKTHPEKDTRPTTVAARAAAATPEAQK